MNTACPLHVHVNSFREERLLFQLAGWRSRRRLSIVYRIPLSEAVAVWEGPSYSLVCKRKLHRFLHHPFRDGEIWHGGFLLLSLEADAPSSVTGALHPDTSLTLSPRRHDPPFACLQKRVAKSECFKCQSPSVSRCGVGCSELLLLGLRLFFSNFFEAHQAGKFFAVSHVLSAAAVASSILIVLVIGTGVRTNP